MTEDEFVKETQFLHEQNLNGREDFLEAFEKGIRAAYQEFNEDSDGIIRDNRPKPNCSGKTVTIDRIEYELKAKK